MGPISQTDENTVGAEVNNYQEEEDDDDYEDDNYEDEAE